MIMLLATLGMKAENPVIELVETTPATGEKYLVNDFSGQVVFTFNRQVTVEKAWIVPASGIRIAITNTWGSNVLKFYYFCGIGDQMRELLSDGTIKVGETFRIELEGIKDKENPNVIYGTDGKAALSLVAGRLPAKLVSISKESGDSIKTYYEPGNPNGTIVFTFSEPVDCQGARISYGDVEKGTYGTKDVPFTVDHEIVNANLQDIDMSPAALKGATSLTLQLRGLKAVSDGGVVESNIPGSPGTVAATYKVTKNTPDNIYGMFRGDLDKDANLQCWISGKATFDAVRFTCMLHGVKAVIEIPAGQITVTDDTENEGAILCAIPLQNLTFDAGAVTVEMVNATDSEGTRFEIKNEFTSVTGRTAAQTVCMGVNPPTGIIDAFPRQFVFTFNDVVTVESGKLSVGGNELPLIVGANILTNNNTVTVTNFRGAFIGDIAFKLQVKDGKGQYITYGATENYVTAEYTIPSNTFVCTEADPAPGKVTSLKTFTLTFASPSQMDNVGGFDPAKKAIVKDESGAEVATGEFTMFDDFDHPWNAIVTLDKEITATGVYTLTIPEATVYNGMFNDMEEDFGVSGGALYNPEKTFTYAVGDIVPTTCAVTPAPGEYEVIPTTYTFTFSRNITVETAKMINDPADRTGTDISSAVSVDGKIATITLPEGSTSAYTQLRFLLKAVDVTGAAVTLGDMEGFVVAEYTTPVVSNIYGCTNITPAAGEIDHLKEFVLTFANPASDKATIGGFDTSKAIVLKNAQGQTAATGTIDFADVRTDVRIELSEEIKAEGTYTLVIPEGTVYNELFDDSAEDFGVSMGAIYNPELTFAYEIILGGIEKATIDQLTGEVSVYNAQGILIRKADISVALKNLPEGIYIVNGIKIAVD